MVESPPKTPQARRQLVPCQALHGMAAVCVCLGLLSACGGKNPRSYHVPESRRLEADVASVREAAHRVLADRGYTVWKSDPATGAIETDWMTVNAGYSASVFLTRNEDRYSDCGKPGLGTTYRGKQARLAVSFSAAGTNQTDILVRAAFRTERSCLSPGPPVVLECRSRGRLEDEFLVETQVRALTNALHKLRRGVP
jgi:hypothetical protein